MPKKQVLQFSAVCLLALLVACSSMTTTPSVRVSGADSWVLLPVNNLSMTPQAGEQAQAMMENILRNEGVQRIETYRAPEQTSLVALMDTAREIATAKAWAKASGFRYAVTGTVHEWHYKTGPDKEPAVGLSLKLMDLQTDQVLWQGTAAKTGWGYASLSSVANKTVQKLLQRVQVAR